MTAGSASASSGTPAGLLRRNADFRRLWTGQTVSAFGDQVTAVALPTAAILVLHATPLQVGALTAVGFAGYPVFGLVAGAWVDRVARRTVLVVADVIRLLAIGSIPLAATLGTLTLTQLYVVGLLLGSAAVFFDVGAQAYVSSLVDREDLPQGNARLEMSNSTAMVGGPALSGGLIQLVGAASAILLDAASYLVSVLSLLAVRRREQPTRRRGSLVPQIREGVRIVFGHRLLRGLTVSVTLANLGRGMALELFLLLAYRGLDMSSGLAGALLALGGVGTLVGAALSTWLAGRFGLGRTLVFSSVAKGLPFLAVPLALVGPPPLVLGPILFVSSFFIPVWNVNNLSLRQYLTPDALQGRVSATVRTVSWAAIPVSGLLGGALGQLGTSLWGDRTGLAVVLTAGGVVWSCAVLALPLRRLFRVTVPADAEAIAGPVDPVTGGVDAT